MKLLTARTAIVASMLFALAMTALEEGGWWWLWFGVAWLAVIGPRLPLLGRMKVPAVDRFIIRENRKVRRRIKQAARRQRRLDREKLKSSKRSRATPL